ncbi:MAG: papain-like cysteine protease family protein [Myxococcales bacterium]
MSRLPFLRCLPLVAAASVASMPLRALAAPVVIDVPEVTQEHDQWCWAGTSQSTLAHFGVQQEQCAIAEYTRTHTNATDVNLGSAECCADWTQGCNSQNYFWYFGGSIADILVHFAGLTNFTFDRPLSLDEVQNSLDVGRLALVRWVWTNGGGHFLLIHGYDGTLTYYMDPWQGEGLKLAEYDWMISGGGHSWATSLTTGRPAATCATSGAQCDDGDQCTTNDTCSGGQCHGTPVRCSAPTCQESACIPSSGRCGPATFLSDGTACDDGDPCTVQDGCLYGACEGTPKACPTTDECQTSGACSPNRGRCVYATAPDGTPCTAGSCQAGECKPKGGCSAAGGGAPMLGAALALLALLRRPRGWRV